MSLGAKRVADRVALLAVFIVQDSDRHTTYGSNEGSPSNSGGSPAMQAPPATRKPTSGQRWQHGTNAAQSNCLTSSAARPWPT